MLNRYYPSEFVCKAVGLAPIGAEVAPENCLCTTCGAPIKQGELRTERGYKIDTNSFLDHPALAATDSNFICSWCMNMLTKDYMQKYSKSLVTESGLYGLASNVDQASFLLDPPTGPFMVFIGAAKQQHLVWRTPVNHSSERFVIRLGIHLLTIHHALLMRAVVAQQRLLQVRKTWMTANKKKPSVILTAFVGGDRELKSTGFYMNDNIVNAVADNPEYAEDLRLVNSLSMGERWALSVIGWSKLSKPEQLIQKLPE